jgi:amidase
MRMITAAVSPSMSEDVGEAFAGSHLAWLKAEKQRARLRAVWSDWFDEYDVLLCPVAPTSAFPHTQEGDVVTRTLEIDGETRSYLEMTSWAGLIGVLGLPSAVAPRAHRAEACPPAHRSCRRSARSVRSVSLAWATSSAIHRHRFGPADRAGDRLDDIATASNCPCSHTLRRRAPTIRKVA